jgi:hypothetical protein
MKNKVLIAGAAGVLVLLAVLLLKLRADTDEAAKPEPEASDPVATRPDTPSPSPSPAPDRAARPAPANPGISTPASPGASMSTPGDGGVPQNRIVRDHRGEPNNATRSPIVPDTVAAIRRAVTPYVKTCAEPLARANQKGAIQVQLTAVASGGKVAIQDVTVSQKDIDDPAFVECVTKAYTQLVIDAPDSQGDAQYKLLMPFPVP